MNNYAHVRARLRAEWNWLEFLERASKGKGLDVELAEAKERSAHWPTCACGVLCRNLPRGRADEPMDPILYSMGADFDYNVKKRNWAQALLIFQGIERRTAELLGLEG